MAISNSEYYDDSPLKGTDRITGAVRALKEGFGFIAGDDGINYFFHWSAMEKTTKNFRELEVQDRVEFCGIEGKPINGKQSFRAVQVRVIS